jgi:YopJ family protease
MPLNKIDQNVTAFGCELDLSQSSRPPEGSRASAGPLKRDYTDLRFEGLARRTTLETDLAAHAWMSQRDINWNVRPGRSTADRDNALMPAIVELENQRKPGLALSFHPNAADAVAEMAGLAGRDAHRRIQFQAANGEGHHFIADVHGRRGHAPSIILVESAIAFPPERYVEVLSQLRSRPELARAAISIIETNAQKSGSDCGMFCLSFAHKMAKHQELFLHLHAKQSRGETLGAGRPMGSVRAYKGENLLPADFYKHAHSMQQVEKLANAASFDPPVGHAVGSSSGLEGLLARRRRLSEPAATGTIGVSIEHKRVDVLVRSLDRLLPRGGRS